MSSDTTANATSGPTTAAIAASTPAAAAAPAVSVSKARWSLLKRALRPRDISSSDTDESASRASVRRHRGFQIMRREEMSEAEASAMNPPADGDEAKLDCRCFQFVRYTLPPLDPAASISPFADATPAALTSAASSPSSLYFRLRRPGSIQLRELAPGQAVDNTGNVCVWNSEEILAYVTRRALLRSAMNPAAAAASPLDSDTPPLQLSLPHPLRPLRVLELGAGMSGLCGLALAHTSFPPLATPSGSADQSVTVPLLSELLLSDGNEACVRAIEYQIAWNAALRQGAGSEQSNSTPVVKATLLKWERHADYSQLGKFDLILAADWSASKRGTHHDAGNSLQAH